MRSGGGAGVETTPDWRKEGSGRKEAKQETIDSLGAGKKGKEEERGEMVTSTRRGRIRKKQQNYSEKNLQSEERKVPSSWKEEKMG